MSDQKQPQHAPVRGALHVQLQALANADSSGGGGAARASTPLKRSRADVQQRISDDLARNSCEMPVDEVFDNMRSQKRFLSEAREISKSRKCVGIPTFYCCTLTLRRLTSCADGLHAYSMQRVKSPYDALMACALAVDGGGHQQDQCCACSCSHQRATAAGRHAVVSWRPQSASLAHLRRAQRQQLGVLWHGESDHIGRDQPQP